MSQSPVLQNLAGLSCAVLVGSLVAAAAGAQEAPVQSSAGGSDDGIQEVVVTATRREESLSKVPVTVEAYTKDQLDDRGVKNFQDIAALTPGITISPFAGETTIAIRGMSSTAGSATTGVYIDDTPIQVRSIGYSSGDIFPQIFDLDRVEVLEGPQGTLFGAGSEGGTVRFIQSQPKLDQLSVYTRGEASNIDNGGNNYEMGLAVGAPIIKDVLGFRVSAYEQHDGGWINAVSGQPVDLDPTGKDKQYSMGLSNETLIQPDTNYDYLKQFRAAVKWAPFDGLSITPSFTVQTQYKNDALASTYWPEISNTGTRSFNIWYPDPVVDSTHQALDTPAHNQPYNDKFELSQLNLQWDVGPLSIYNNTSYFARQNLQYLNGYQLYDLIYAGYAVPQQDNLSDLWYINSQHNITEELRFQPRDPSGKMNWTAGLFFQRAAQNAAEAAYDNFEEDESRIYGAVSGGEPFGAGSSAYENWYGENPLNGTEDWYGHFYSVDKQYALYGQADYSFTNTLKATVGVRVARDENYFESDYNAPQNNLNAPQGSTCIYTTGCTPGVGAYAIQYQSGTSTSKETAATPKAELSWQATPDALYYVSATEGFRPGGGEISLAKACAAGLEELGYSNGESPGSYGSDHVWSYELGTKNKLADGLFQFAASAYYEKWTNIQSSVTVLTCFQSFTSNLGAATGKGVDLSMQFRPVYGLTFGANMAYGVLSFDQRVAPGGATVYSNGSAVPGSGPPFQITGTIDYQTPMPFLPQAKLYFHSDSMWQSDTRIDGATDPQSIDYDALEAPISSYFTQNARLGARWNGLDVSLFVKNMLNDFPNLGLTRTSGTVVWINQTLQPRTAGITLTYRY